MNFLIIRAGGIGDALLTLPVVQALGDSGTATGIEVLGSISMCEVARLTSLVSGCHSIDDSRFSALYGGSTRPELRAFLQRFDMVYAFNAADPETFRRRLMNGGARACRILDPREPADLRRHISRHLLSILDEPPDSVPLPVLTSRRRVRDGGVLIHPGSGGIKKNWPMGRFVELGNRLGRPVTFLLGPAEMERGIPDGLPGRVVAGMSLAEVRDIMLESELYIGNDSGMSHLAGMLGIRTLALFGPTDPRIWRPLGPSVRTIRAYGRNLDELSVDEVHVAASEMIQHE